MFCINSNRIKKITQLITITFTALALILAVFPFHQAAYSAQNNGLEITYPQQHTAEISLPRPSNMATGQLDIVYDSTLFTVQDVSQGSLLEQEGFFFETNTDQAGIIKVAWFSLTSTNKSGPLVKAVFSGSDKDTLKLDLKNIELKKEDGSLIRLGAAVIKLQIGNKEARVNDVATTLDAAPFIHKSRTMVPARFVSEQLGAEVIWLPESRQVRIEDGSKTIILTIDSTKSLVDGSEEELEAPAMIVNSRTFVPLRFVTETLGAKVTWHDSTRSITIE